MKYIKTFENIENLPEIDDWVIMKTLSSHNIVKNFINNTIGEVVNLDKTNIQNIDITVMYYDIPEDFKKLMNVDSDVYVREFRSNQIVEFAKTKEELELKLQSNKYNI